MTMPLERDPALAVIRDQLETALAEDRRAENLWTDDRGLHARDPQADGKDA